MMKEEALKWLDAELCIWERDCKSKHAVKDALKMAIKALEHEPCEGAINREKTKQFLYERIDRLNDDELYDIFSKIIDDMYNELPSVTPQPKAGHWIEYSWNDNGLSRWGLKCDKCHKKYKYGGEIWNNPNFCPNCGVKMVE